MVVPNRSLLILIYIHLTILNVVIYSEWTIDWDLIVVRPQSMQLSVLVQEKSALQQSVISGFYARNKIGW
jgi:hypothetical protein